MILPCLLCSVIGPNSSQVYQAVLMWRTLKPCEQEAVAMLKAEDKERKRLDKLRKQRVSMQKSTTIPWQEHHLLI
jgi:hypothetical protein